MTAQGLLVRAPNAMLYVEVEPIYPCTHLPAQMIFHPHDPMYHSAEFPCAFDGDGLGGVHLIMSPLDNVPWDGDPCNSTFDRPGCGQCLCSEYQQRWHIAPYCELLIPDGYAGLLVQMDGGCAIPPPCTWPCHLPDPETGVVIYNPTYCDYATAVWPAGRDDYNCDGYVGTDRDIEDFFACLAGDCCEHCTPDFDWDGAPATDADIECFFRVLGGGSC